MNNTVTASSGAEIVSGLAQYPIHDFELTYNFLRDGSRWGAGRAPLEFKTMMGFALMMGGTLGRFLFKNPDDNAVFQNIIGTGDGVTATFTITRKFGANGYFQTEPVGQVFTDHGINVYLAGSATPVLPSLYSISTAIPGANTITFSTPPASGVAIAIDMQFYYYCKMTQDNFTVEKFMDRLWMLQKVAFRSCKPGA